MAMTEKEVEARQAALMKRAGGHGVPFEKNDTPKHEKTESAAERKKEHEK